MEDGWDGFVTGLKEGLTTTIVDDHNSGCRLESFKAQGLDEYDVLTFRHRGAPDSTTQIQSLFDVFVREVELMNTSAEAAINHQAEEADEGMERKRRRSSEEVSEINDPKSHDQLIQKKPRFVWTTELHNRFLDAVTELGLKKAVPTKILRVMNVEGLTRENVASHLQKFRIQMKKRAREQLAGGAPPRDDSNTYCPLMSGISQQALVLPNTIMMQCRNMQCACFSPQQLLPSFPSQNSNMFGLYPTVQEAYFTQFKDVLFNEGVGRTTGAEVAHGFSDGNAPYGLDELQFNFPLPPKPLVDPFSFNDDATLVAQYHRPGELSLADQLVQNTEGLGGGLVQCPPQATANHLDGMNDDLITRGQIFDGMNDDLITPQATANHLDGMNDDLITRGQIFDGMNDDLITRGQIFDGMNDDLITPQATANHLDGMNDDLITRGQIFDGMNDDLITRGQIFDVEEEFFSFDAGNESPVNWLQDLEYKGIDDLFRS